jgi:hypothetical protein
MGGFNVAPQSTAKEVCPNAEHCDRGLTNTEYPGFSRDWALDVQYWALKQMQMRITNVEYRITNAEYPWKRVLNNWWILDIGCSVLVIEANANIQCRISNSECPTGKCASSMIKVAILRRAAVKNLLWARNSAAQHKTV